MTDVNIEAREKIIGFVESTDGLPFTATNVVKSTGQSVGLVNTCLRYLERRGELTKLKQGHRAFWQTGMSAYSKFTRRAPHAAIQGR